MPTIAIAVLQALPSLLQTGFNAYQLIQHVNDSAIPVANPTEDFAAKILAQLPALIDAGIDITAAVQHSAGAVSKMQAENRGPNAAELAEQASRLAAADAAFDAAAKPGS